MTIPVAWQLQTGLYTMLREDAQLQTFIGDPARIFDTVQTDAIFPFLTIGASRSEPLDGVDGAQVHDTRIVAYSRWGGRSEVKAIADRVAERVENAAIPMQSAVIVSRRLVFSDVLRPFDPETYQSVMRFRILTEQES